MTLYHCEAHSVLSRFHPQVLRSSVVYQTVGAGFLMPDAKRYKGACASLDADQVAATEAAWLDARGVRRYNYTALALQDVKSGEKHDIPLPENARINHISWSPDGSRVAFTVRTAEIGADAVPKIHILDASTGSVTKLEQPVNAVLGAPFTWLPCSSKLIVRRPIGTHADAPSGDAVPSSPSMQEAAGGCQKAAVRTYPNLRTSAEDAAAFADKNQRRARIRATHSCTPSRTCRRA